MTMLDSGKIGIAFVKGLNMFGRKNISSSQIRRLLKRVEFAHKANVRFIGIYGKHSDIIMFKKAGVQYATIGSWIEKALKSELGEDVCVTTRSLKVVKGVVSGI